MSMTVDHAALTKALNDLARRTGDARPALTEIGEMMLTSISKNFDAQGRYSAIGSWRGGTKTWEPLSAVTLLAKVGGKKKMYTKKGAVRAKAGRILAKNKILQDSERLKASIDKRVRRDGLVIFTKATVRGKPVGYARIHQFGGKAGRGKKITIRARPYLVMQDDDITEAMAIIKRHIMEGRANG